MKLAHVSTVFGLLFVSMAPGCGSADAGDDAASEAELRRNQVVLRVPLVDRAGKLLSSHNDELERNGVAPITQDYVDFLPGRLESGLAKWNSVRDRIDEAGANADLSFEMESYAEPYNYVTRSASMCWNGNARKAVDIIASLTDSVFSDQLLIHGWRYKRQVESESLEEGDDSFMPPVWREWRGNGEAILMVTASSDGGEETNVAIVPKCR